MNALRTVGLALLVLLPLKAAPTAHYYEGHLYTTSAKERDAAVKLGYVSEGTCCSVWMPADPTVPTPLYRLLGKQGEHLLTTSLDEADDAVAHYGYKWEGACCSAFLANAVGTIPIFRLRKASGGDRLYTTQPEERDAAISKYNYIDEGICCAASPPGVPSVTLFRLYHPGLKRHFFTVSSAERDELIAKSGWTNEGSCCNLPLQSSRTPLYRLVQPHTRDHFYTTSLAERNSLPEHGYKLEGICCDVEEGQGSVPIFRLSSSEWNAHFYTVSDSEEQNAVNMLGFTSEGVCCSAAHDSQAVPLYRLSVSGCEDQDISTWHKIKNFFNGDVDSSCPKPPPPDLPQISLSASPDNGYACLGVMQTVQWSVTHCDSCYVSLSGKGTGYASSFMLSLSNLPVSGEYSTKPQDQVEFTVNATSTVGSKQAKISLFIDATAHCRSSK